MGVDFRTQAIHAGYEPLDNGRAAVPPIYASAAFDLGDAARGDALAGGDIDGFEYSPVWPIPLSMHWKSGLPRWRAVSAPWLSAQAWPQHTDWMPHFFIRSQHAHIVNSCTHICVRCLPLCFER